MIYPSSIIIEKPQLELNLDITGRRLVASGTDASPRRIPLAFTRKDKINIDVRTYLQSGVSVPPLIRTQPFSMGLIISNGADTTYVTATNWTKLGEGDISDPRWNCWLEFNTVALDTLLGAIGGASVGAMVEMEVGLGAAGPNQHFITVREQCTLYKTSFYPLP
jgi:hypothetical protein